MLMAVLCIQGTFGGERKRGLVRAGGSLNHLSHNRAQASSGSRTFWPQTAWPPPELGEEGALDRRRLANPAGPVYLSE